MGMGMPNLDDDDDDDDDDEDDAAPMAEEGK
mgnify:CR=1 FL=1